MSAHAYPFIDIAACDGIRERFASGLPLAVLSGDLTRLIWANGPGAALFDGAQDLPLGAAARRQIAATRGFPDIGTDRPVSVRLERGRAAGGLMPFLASAVTLPQGERAILLSGLAGEEKADPADAAAAAISGLGDENALVALVDETGSPLAASGGFREAEFDPELIAALVRLAGAAPSGLVKKAVAAGHDRLAAGVLRLSDAPGRYLLMLVTEIAEAPRPDIAAGSEDEAGLPPNDMSDTAAATSAPPEPASPDDWYFNAASRERAAQSEGPPPPVSTPAPLPPAAAPDRDETEPDADARGIGPSAASVRFVWRTDAQGRISMIGPELERAVGASASIAGRAFAEVASELGLDPDGEIAGLLERRDTWSGRTVQWPVTGTDLVVPVDLAALPVYNRDRVFEGFRGFGVARMGEALQAQTVKAPSTGTEPIHEPAAIAEPPPEPEEADPFQGEVPVLDLGTGPARRHSDKVIRLAEHRPRPERSLSSSERISFREIGQRLQEAGIAVAAPADAPDRPDAAMDEVMPAAEEAPADAGATEAELPEIADDRHEPATRSAPPETVAIGDAALEAVDEFGDWATQAALTSPLAAPMAPPPEVVKSETEEDGTQAFAGEADVPAASETPQPVAASGAPADTDVPAKDAAPEMPAEVEDTDAPPAAAPTHRSYAPAAFAGIGAGALPGLDASVMSRLPVPLLVHCGDVLHYANRDFLDLTGYDTLAALREAGGLDAIFAEPREASDGAGRKLTLRRSDGEEMPVDAFLQSVDWNGARALLLALRPLPVQAPEPPAEPEPEPAAPAEAAAPAEGDTELAARLDELRTIIDTATDGVVIVDNDGAIVSISRPAEALFGFDTDAVKGQPFETLFAIESQRAARDYLTGLSGNGVASLLNDGRELIGREAQGRFIPLFMTIGRLPAGRGYCAVMRDITHWKRVEEELTQARAQAERASSQKTAFLARVSHEIRTPLNAIIGFSELMIDEKFGAIGNERYRDYLRDINRSGNHVLDLVNDLLDISKIEAGEQEMSYEAVQLNVALGEAVALMQPQANRERVIIRSSFASRLPDVVADLRSIRQIALNLLSNAIRYTQPGGQVIVSTSYEPSGDIVMRVRDTGIGMSPAELEQALKPFKQVNALKRPRGDGTGLGLPLTKAMAEANRARFAIHSASGEGTLVEIAFPSTRVLAH